MPVKKYIVTLTKEEKKVLSDIVNKGKYLPKPMLYWVVLRVFLAVLMGFSCPSGEI